MSFRAGEEVTYVGETATVGFKKRFNQNITMSK